MLLLKPLVSELCRCPQCDRELDHGRVIINGMRNLVDISCAFCDADYYMDLPSGHGLFYQVAVNKHTGQVYNPSGVEWFANMLVDSICDMHYEHVPITFRRERRHERIVLLNCLDFLYGHCLLKLLNAQHYLDNHPELACCVLVPKQLAHLVPDGVAEVWEVDLPLKRFQNWYVSLQQQIEGELEARDVCYLSVGHSHPHFSRYDLHRFAKLDQTLISDGRCDRVKLVFVYREDRLWGRSIRRQTKNINKLYKELRQAL